MRPADAPPERAGLDVRTPCAGSSQRDVVRRHLNESARKKAARAGLAGPIEAKGFALLRPHTLPPVLATRSWEQNLDAMSVLSSRGVCLLSPDNTQAILTHWPGVAQVLRQLHSGSGTEGRARPPWAITDVAQYGHIPQVA